MSDFFKEVKNEVKKEGTLGAGKAFFGRRAVVKNLDELRKELEARLEDLKRYGYDLPLAKTKSADNVSTIELMLSLGINFTQKQANALASALMPNNHLAAKILAKKFSDKKTGAEEEAYFNAALECPNDYSVTEIIAKDKLGIATKKEKLTIKGHNENPESDWTELKLMLGKRSENVPLTKEEQVLIEAYDKYSSAPEPMPFINIYSSVELGNLNEADRSHFEALLVGGEEINESIDIAVIAGKEKLGQPMNDHERKVLGYYRIAKEMFSAENLRESYVNKLLGRELYPAAEVKLEGNLLRIKEKNGIELTENESKQLAAFNEFENNPYAATLRYMELLGIEPSSEQKLDLDAYSQYPDSKTLANLYKARVMKENR